MNFCEKLSNNKAVRTTSNAISMHTLGMFTFAFLQKQKFDMRPVIIESSQQVNQKQQSADLKYK